jgi:hypothetical protein
MTMVSSIKRENHAGVNGFRPGSWRWEYLAFLQVEVVALRQPRPRSADGPSPRLCTAERGATRRSATSCTVVDASAMQKGKMRPVAVSNLEPACFSPGRVVLSWNHPYEWIGKNESIPG